MRRATDLLVAAGFALAGLVVVLLPAVAVQSGVLNAGVGSLDDDVFLASAVVGAVHMVLAWTRLLDEERTATRRLHLWVASLNGLVVLGLAASLLLLGVLYAFPDEHASLANRGFPVSALWAGTQGVAVLLAEITARFFFWWLEPHEPVRGGRRGAPDQQDPGQAPSPDRPRAGIAKRVPGVQRGRT